MKMELIADLVFDTMIYPRHDIDRTHVKLLGEAFEADQPLPPIVACKETKKIIDGVHRWHWLVGKFEKDAKWYIKWEKFSSDEQRFLRAVELNGKHGMRLQKYDRAHCQVIAQRLGIDTATLAAGFGCTVDKFDGSTKDRFTSAVNEMDIPKDEPLKRSIRHMAGHKLTKVQINVNKRLSGWPPRFHADQLIDLIDAQLLNLEDEKTMERLRVLREKLDSVLAATA